MLNLKYLLLVLKYCLEIIYQKYKKYISLILIFFIKFQSLFILLDFR